MKKIIFVFLASLLLTACSNRIEESGFDAVKKELESRYDSIFTLKTVEYDDDSMYSGVAIDENGKECDFILQGGKLKDNYYIHFYEEDILSYIYSQMDLNGLSGEVIVEYSPNGKRLESDVSVDYILHSRYCSIYYEVYVSNSSKEECLSIVHQWIEYLFDLDYVWYFDVYDESNNVVSFSSYNNTYQQISDWTDEEIEQYMFF